MNPNQNRPEQFDEDTEVQCLSGAHPFGDFVLHFLCVFRPEAKKVAMAELLKKAD